MEGGLEEKMGPRASFCQGLSCLVSPLQMTEYLVRYVGMYQGITLTVLLSVIYGK